MFMFLIEIRLWKDSSETLSPKLKTRKSCYEIRSGLSMFLIKKKVTSVLANIQRRLLTRSRKTIRVVCSENMACLTKVWITFTHHKTKSNNAKIIQNIARQAIFLEQTTKINISNIVNNSIWLYLRSSYLIQFGG